MRCFKTSREPKCQKLNIEKNIQNIGRLKTNLKKGFSNFKVALQQIGIFPTKLRNRDSGENDIYESSSNEKSKCCEKTIRINRLDILLTCIFGIVIIVGISVGIIFGMQSEEEEISEEFR